MYSRWFNVTVFALWLTMMGWLVSQKVLPALLVGEPPSYATILEAQQEQPVVGWLLFWNGRRLGWAISNTFPLPHGLTQTDSRIHFDDLPLEEMTPEWLRAVVRPLGRQRTGLAMEAVSTLVFDPLGRLSRFESAVQFEPRIDALKVKGTIDGGTLSLTVRAGDFTYDKELPLPGSAMLSDALSPQSRLPGLREGQTWTVEVYSPLLPPNAPLDILQATVEGRRPIHWGGKTVQAWLVVFRDDPGSGRGADAVPRGRLWVHPDGDVIKQEVTLFGATMTLQRLPPPAAAGLVKAVANRPSSHYDSTKGAIDRPRNP